MCKSILLRKTYLMNAGGGARPGAHPGAGPAVTPAVTPTAPAAVEAVLAQASHTILEVFTVPEEGGGASTGSGPIMVVNVARTITDLMSSSLRLVLLPPTACLKLSLLLALFLKQK